MDREKRPHIAMELTRSQYDSIHRRLQPGYIPTDLLRNPSDASKFLSIDFWTSIRAQLAARRSPEVRSFLLWLSRQHQLYS